MREPDRAVPDVVPTEWMVQYRDEIRAARHDRVTREVDHLAETTRRDSWALTAASGLCVLMFVVALASVITIARPGGAPALGLLVVLAAFGACLWLVSRGRPRPRDDR